VNASSYWSAEIHKPEYITDGLVDGNFIHTFTDAAPWIRIYLLALYDVTVIKIWNRPLTYHGKATRFLYYIFLSCGRNAWVSFSKTSGYSRIAHWESAAGACNHKKQLVPSE